MTEMEIFALESRIESINNAIAQMRRDATPATDANVEMAIEMLALPELERVEAQLVEARQKSADMDKFLNNPIFTERK
jgi:predicted  nucleic acid-binding Zn-ribbon protein